MKYYEDTYRQFLRDADGKKTKAVKFDIQNRVKSQDQVIEETKERLGLSPPGKTSGQGKVLFIKKIDESDKLVDQLFAKSVSKPLKASELRKFKNLKITRNSKVSKSVIFQNGQNTKIQIQSPKFMNEKSK